MKTIEITLMKKTQAGTDPLGQPIYTTEPVKVAGVLVGEPTSDEINNAITMYGKRAQYTIAIPKGDANTWEDTTVILPAPFDGTFRTIGYPKAGIEENIPLKWNKKILVEKVNE